MDERLFEGQERKGGMWMNGGAAPKDPANDLVRAIRYIFELGPRLGSTVAVGCGVAATVLASGHSDPSGEAGEGGARAGQVWILSNSECCSG